MGNMSYCRFENTSSDLQDCINAVGEMIEGGYDLNEYETRGFRRLIEQAAELLQLIGETVGIDAEEIIEKVEWKSESIVEEFRDLCGDGEDRAGKDE